MTTLPRTGATQLAPSQAIPETTVNEALRYLDANATRAIIEDRDLTSPPGTCADGACYFVATSGSGLWSGKSGKLAIAVGTNAANGWLFMTVAVEGYRLYIRDEDAEIIYNGSAWTASSTTITPSIQAVTSSATVTPTFSDDMVKITAQAAGLTLANPTGTAVPGRGMAIRIKDNGTARSISYGTQYRAIGVTLPTTTVISKTLYLGLIYNSDDTKWDVVAVAQEA